MTAWLPEACLPQVRARGRAAPAGSGCRRGVQDADLAAALFEEAADDEALEGARDGLQGEAEDLAELLAGGREADERGRIGGRGANELGDESQHAVIGGLSAEREITAQLVEIGGRDDGELECVVGVLGEPGAGEGHRQDADAGAREDLDRGGIERGRWREGAEAQHMAGADDAGGDGAAVWVVGALSEEALDDGEEVGGGVALHDADVTAIEHALAGVGVAAATEAVGPERDAAADEARVRGGDSHGGSVLHGAMGSKGAGARELAHGGGADRLAAFDLPESARAPGPPRLTSQVGRRRVSERRCAMVTKGPKDPVPMVAGYLGGSDEARAAIERELREIAEARKEGREGGFLARFKAWEAEQLAKAREENPPS